MTEQGEVKFKVRRLANSLGEFTIKQLASITGLNESSIRTELDRMRESGYLTVDRTEGPEEGKKGRPVSIYKIVSDPVKKTQLMQSIMAFYPRAQETIVGKPESPHYLEAVAILEQQLDRAQKGMQSTSDQLQLALEHLQIAQDDEAAGQRGVELIGAWINCAKATAYALMGEWEGAIGLKQEAEGSFRDAGLLEPLRELEETDRYICAAQIAEMGAVEAALAKHEYRPAAQHAEVVHNVLQGLGSNDPRILISLTSLRLLQMSCYDSLEWKTILDNRLSSAVYSRSEQHLLTATKRSYERVISEGRGFPEEPEMDQMLRAIFSSLPPMD